MAEPMKCDVCERDLTLAEPRYVHADGHTYRHPIRPVPRGDAASDETGLDRVREACRRAGNDWTGAEAVAGIERYNAAISAAAPSDTVWYRPDGSRIDETAPNTIPDPCPQRGCDYGYPFGDTGRCPAHEGMENP